MKRTRIRLSVYINLDLVPGTFHTAQSAREVVSSMLQHSIPHYEPEVVIDCFAVPQRTLEDVHVDIQKTNSVYRRTIAELSKELEQLNPE